MFNDAFAQRTVLVTGHTGFKGAWLALWLRRLGARVVGYALDPPTDPSLFGSCGPQPVDVDVRRDIRDGAALERVVREQAPDYIFHLAAQPLVRESYRSPRETFEVNVIGTLAVLEAVRAAARPCTVLGVSTDKCYENREWVYGYRESDPLGGHDPYSASKGAMEIAFASFRSSFFPPAEVARHGVRMASARAGNVVGGGDWSADRIVPDAVRALLRGEPLEVRNPASIRPWQHVLEPLSGYLGLAARLAAPGGEALSGGWNFGPTPGLDYSVGQVADALVAAWGHGTWTSPPPRADAPHEARLLKLCIDQATSELGWRPVWDFATTIERTARWYQRTAEARPSCSALAACQGDIEAYEDAARSKGLAWTS